MRQPKGGLCLSGSVEKITEFSTWSIHSGGIIDILMSFLIIRTLLPM